MEILNMFIQEQLQKVQLLDIMLSLAAPILKNSGCQNSSDRVLFHSIIVFWESGVMTPNHSVVEHGITRSPKSKFVLGPQISLSACCAVYVRFGIFEYEL